jgi:hypothetical protein
MEAGVGGPAKEFERTAVRRKTGMDTAHWKHGDEFAVLDLIAKFEFKTASSLSFLLGTKGDWLQTPGMDRPWFVGGGRVFTVVGWLDIHHPCEGFHRLQLRVGLPDRYVCWESMRDLVPQVITALEMPPDESYHVNLAGLSRGISMEDPQSCIVS